MPGPKTMSKQSGAALYGCVAHARVKSQQRKEESVSILRKCAVRG